METLREQYKRLDVDDSFVMNLFQMMPFEYLCGYCSHGTDPKCPGLDCDEASEKCLDSESTISDSMVLNTYTT